MKLIINCSCKLRIILIEDEKEVVSKRAEEKMRAFRNDIDEMKYKKVKMDASGKKG